MEWISVKDSHPKEGEPILFFYTPSKYIISGYLVEDEVCEEGHFHHMEVYYLNMLEDRDFHFEDVSHWMPLPEPPFQEVDG